MNCLHRTFAAAAAYGALAVLCTPGLLVIALTFWLTPVGSAQPPQGSLLCAKDEKSAEAALLELAASADSPLGFPSDPSATPPSVRAAEVDALLLSLAQAHAQWPGLRAKIEAQVLSWNYCDIFYGGEGWDLFLEDGVLYRARATRPDGGYPGFRAWGFVPGVPHIVPSLLEENELGRGQREWFVGSSVLERCFPHPVTGLTPFTSQNGAIQPPGAVAKESLKTLASAPAKTPEELCPPSPDEAEKQPVAAAEPAPAVIAPVPTVVASIPIPPSGGAPGDAPTTVTSSRGHWSVSGSLFTSISTMGRTSMGLRAAVSPLESFYVRGGLVEQIDPNAWQRPTYSWGVGYNDWRPNTFSLELNHWGPIPIDEFDLWGSMVDVGYKVPLPQGLARFLGLGVGINYPLKMTPGLGAALNFKPWGDWFVMSGVRCYPFNDTKFTWTYGFGNWSWKPYTFSLAYNNWGPNEVFDFNFDRNGVITFAWSWVL